MSRARCPSCSRWLHLPQAAQGKSVQCPICQQVFTAPEFSEESVSPPPRLPVPEPSQPWRPSASSAPELEATLEFRPPRDTSHRSPVSRSLGSLANWVFGLALVSFLWNATCGCGGLFSLGGLLPEAQEFLILLAFLLYFVPLVVYLIVMITSHTLSSSTSNRGPFRFGLALVQFEYLFGSVRLVMMLKNVLERGEPEILFYLNAVSLALSIGLLISSTLAWRQLGRETSTTDARRNDPEED